MFPLKVCCLILLICFTGAGPACICARAQELNFIHYNTNNSALPHDICYGLMQDRRGYLWVGTDNGLVRFDGRDMKIYRQCFRSPFVIVTAEYDSTFLVATWTGGVYKLMHDSVKRLRSINPDWIASANEIVLYKDVVLLYHFSTPDYFRLNSRGDTLNFARFFVADTNGRLALLQGGGLPPMGLNYGVLNDQLIAYGENGIFRLKDSVFIPVSRQPFDHLLQSAADGNIYGFHAGWLYMLSGNLRSCRRVCDLRKITGTKLKVSKFIMLASGNLVLQLSHSACRRSAVVKQMYINTHTLHAISLERLLGIDVFISDIIPDRENGFWVGTDGNGMYHVLEPQYRQYGNTNEFANPFVTALMQDECGRTYIGTKNGIYLLGDNKLQLVYPGAYVHRFFRHCDGSIRAQQYDRNNVLLTGNKAVLEAANTLCAITAHYFIVERKDDLARFTDRRTGELLVQINRKVPLISRAICEDRTGCVWHGSDRGLYWWHEGDTAAVPYPDTLLSTVRIIQLVPDSSGGLWVVTAGAGLFYLQQEKVVAVYNEQNGLSNTSVTAVLLHAGKIYIGTPNGLNVLDRHTGHISVYKKYDGLIASDVTALAPFTDSEVVVGSSKGITIFRNKQETPVHRPMLTLERVMVDDKVVNAQAPVTGSYKSRISLTYNVVSFLYPELVRFQYRLSGNDAWIETAGKSIVLTSLAPGRYELEIRARKYNSVWSAPLVLPLEIKKPWWRTNMFYGLLGLAAMLCIYMVLRSRSVSIHKQLLHRQQFAELKLKALQAQLNPHFVSNALSAIQFFTLTHDEVSANDYLAKFAGLTRMLLESSRSRFVTLKDELQIITYYFELEKLRFKDLFVYGIKLGPEIDIDHEWLPGVLLQPFVENSINHGIVYLPKEIQGQVQVQISRQNGALLIEITDNGVGRNKAREIQQRTVRAHKSRSAEIISEISQSVNNLEGCYMDIAITDMTDEKGNATGTKVTISCVIANKYRPHYANSDY